MTLNYSNKIFKFTSENNYGFNIKYYRHFYSNV